MGCALSSPVILASIAESSPESAAGAELAWACDRHESGAHDVFLSYRVKCEGRKCDDYNKANGLVEDLATFLSFAGTGHADLTTTAAAAAAIAAPSTLSLASLSGGGASDITLAPSPAGGKAAPLRVFYDKVRGGPWFSNAW